MEKLEGKLVENLGKSNTQKKMLYNHVDEKIGV